LIKQTHIDLQQVSTKGTLKSNILAFDIQKKNLDLAESVYNTTKKKFEQGVGSSFEVIQAENDLQTAQGNYFDALYRATLAKIDYLRALGRL
jgi:outer membrane protein TolC